MSALTFSEVPIEQLRSEIAQLEAKQLVDVERQRALDQSSA